MEDLNTNLYVTNVVPVFDIKSAAVATGKLKSNYRHRQKGGGGVVPDSRDDKPSIKSSVPVYLQVVP